MPTRSRVQQASGLEALGHHSPHAHKFLCPAWGLVWPRGPRFFGGLEASARPPQVLELFLAFSHKGSLPMPHKFLSFACPISTGPLGLMDKASDF